MKLTWYCAMCGNHGEAEIDTAKPILSIESVVLSVRGWIVQHNGLHLDIYCCKVCAK